MKVLNFKANSSVTSFSPEVSEVVTVNFRKKEVTKIVEFNNETGRIMSTVEIFDAPPTPFMGEGFSEFVELALKKHSPQVS